MKAMSFLFALLVIAAALVSGCAGFPAKRVDTVLRGAVPADLGVALGEVTINSGMDQFALERVLRELFPLAAAHLEGQGLAGRAPRNDRAEYSVWLREEEYTSGLDTRSAVLCVLKLRSKTDGSVYATTIVADDTNIGGTGSASPQEAFAGVAIDAGDINPDAAFGAGEKAGAAEVDPFA